MTYVIGCTGNRCLRVNGVTAGPRPFEKGIIGDRALLWKMFSLTYQLPGAIILFQVRVDCVSWPERANWSRGPIGAQWYVLYDSRSSYYVILISTTAFRAL